MKKIDIAFVVDDDPIYVFGIKRAIEIVGFCKELMVFENGQEALDSIIGILTSNKELPDVILLDLNMPVMDGWEFIEEFIKIPCPKDILIYVVSSSIDPEDIKRAKSLESVSGYVVKPISLDSLKDILMEFQKAG